MAIYNHNKTYKEFKPELSKNQLEQEVVRVKELVDDKTQQIYTREVKPGDNLQQVINSMPYGGQIILRNGTHYISNHIYIKPGISIKGESAYGVVLKGTVGMPGLQVINPYQSAYNLQASITHGSDIVSIPVGYNILGMRILLDGVFYNVVEKINQTDYRLIMPYVGDDLTNANTIAYATNTEVKFDSFTIDGAYIYAGYADEIFLYDLLIKNSDTAIIMDYCANFSIKKTDVVASNNAIRLNNCSYIEMVSNGAFNITNNAFEFNSCKDAYATALFSSRVVTSVSVSNSNDMRIDGSFRHSSVAVSLTASSDVIIGNSTIRKNQTGININDSDNTIIKGNSFDTNNTAINIANTTSNDNLILGNIFKNNTSNVSNNGTGTIIRSNVGVADN